MEQHNKLSDSNKVKLYTWLCQLEYELKNTFGMFDINSRDLKDFLEQERILLGSMSEKNEKEKRNYKYFLLCNLRKPEKYKNIIANDQAYLHLKHIRNSIAHGNVISLNRLNFEIRDYSEQGNKSAEGKISCELFYRLINELLKTKK